MRSRLLVLSTMLGLALAGMAGADAGPVSPTAKPKPAAAVHVSKLKKAKKPKPLAAAKKEHWVCPMHDGGESDHAGKCKKCGMDLVREDI